MRDLPDMDPQDRGDDTPSEPPATGRKADGGGPAPLRLLRLVVDFNRLEQRPDGTASIEVGAVGAPVLAGLGLQEGMRAVFEEPGELQMTGVLHRRASTIGLLGSGDMQRTVGGDRWDGELDPHSTTYHVRVEPLTLYYAGLEGCGHYHEWVEAPNPDAADAGAMEPAAPPPETRPRRPARQLTLGVEGTYDQWQRPLAALTVDGEAALHEGEGIVLIDEAREVDATVRILRLPPDGQYPEGRRVWLAEPDWGTVRPNPIAFRAIPEM